MGEFLKSIGNSIMGIAIFIGIVFLVIFFIKGGFWLSAIVLPWLSIIMWFAIALDILIFLPLGIFKRTKGASALGLVLSSYIFGLTVWFWAFLLAYLIWGAGALFIGLFLAGVGVVPIAILATAIKGEWAITGQIILLVILTFGTRELGFYIARRIEVQDRESITKSFLK